MKQVEIARALCRFCDHRWIRRTSRPQKCPACGKRTATEVYRKRDPSAPLKLVGSTDFQRYCEYLREHGNQATDNAATQALHIPRTTLRSFRYVRPGMFIKKGKQVRAIVWGLADGGRRTE